MKEIFDAQTNYLASKKKLKQFIIFYFLLTFIILSVIIVLFLTSKENYLLPLIVNIVLTIIFVWVSIYFFTNPFKTLHDLHRFYHDLNNAEFVEGEVTILNIKKDKVYKFGLEFFVFEALEKVQDTIYHRDLYFLELDETIAFNELIKVKTFSNVLVAFEEKK